MCAELLVNCLISHSVPLLKSLHWLPIRYRIIFKICTITYQALSSGQPAYLHSLLTPARKARQLRSSTSHLLFNPRIKTSIGTRAFSIAAPTLWNPSPGSVKSPTLWNPSPGSVKSPTLWNPLPVSVKSCEAISTFRRHLKTYLFDLAA